ncbi:MAG: O-antigen ligase family protein, partial [Vicinamibacterales bacterium]
TAHRIPASFVNAHAFAGTMVTTLVLLIGAWSQPHERRWIGPLMASASVASFLGVFMAATRTHMITAAVLAGVVTLTGGLSRSQRVRWLAALALIGYIVAADTRLQRFTTLTEKGALSERIGNSVNQNFFDVVAESPLGNGLTSGGTSVPYFLRSRHSGPPLLLESEYARIAIEQGLPGLLLWALFIFWVALKIPAGGHDSWLLGRRLAWAACLSIFVSGMLGIGMMASVPQASIMLLLIGWFTSPPKTEVVEDEAFLATAKQFRVA